MLNKIILNKVIIEGFKIYKDKVEKIIGDNTIFVGGNGQGKSSIADAICWCITGRFYEGSKNLKSDFLNKQSKKAVVEIELVDDNGELRTIKRSYTVASGISLWLDGKTITQRKLGELINPDRFLLAFNPVNFLTKDQSEGKKIILDLVNFDTMQINNNDILSKITKENKQLLINIDPNEIDRKLKEVKGYISKNEKMLIQNEGYISKNITTMEELNNNSKPTDPKLIEELEKEIKELINKRPNMLEFEKSIKKQSDLKNQLTKVSMTKFDSNKRNEIKNEIIAIDKEILQIQKLTFSPANILKIEVDVNNANKDLERLTKENNILRSKVNSIREKYSQEEGDTCPLCRTKLTKENAVNIKRFVATQIQDSMNQGINNRKTIEEIEANLKELLAKTNLIKKEDQEKKEKFEANKLEKISILNKKKIALNNQLKNIFDEEKVFDEKKADKIGELNKLINSFNIADASEFKLYEDDLNVKKQKLDDYKKHDSHVLVNNQRIQDLIKENGNIELESLNLRNKIETGMKLVNAINNYNQAKIEVIEEYISSFFNKVSFKIEELNEKTGEYKPCFKVLYDNKNIELCSYSEQIKAGIEISEMIQNSMNLEYPLFIDNNESIIKINSSIKQVIKAVVVDVEQVKTIKESTLCSIVESAKNIVSNAI